MRRFQDLKVATKTGVALIAAALSRMLVGSLSVLQLGQVAADACAVYDDGVEPTADIGIIRRATNLTRLESANLLIATTPRGNIAAERAAQEADSALDKAVAAYVPKTVDPAALQKFVAVWPDYRRVRDTELRPPAEASNVKTWEAARDA